MARRRLTYWEKRAVEHERLVRQGLNIYQPVIAQAYAEAQRYLTRKVRDIYRRYLARTDLSEEEVMAILNSRVAPEDIVELKLIAKTIEDQAIQKQATDVLNLLAVQHRITKLESLKAASFVVSKKIADVQLRESTNYLIDTIHQSHRQASAEAIIGNTEEVFDVYEGGNFPRFLAGGDRPKIDIVNPNTGNVVRTIQLEPQENVTRFNEISTRKVKTILETPWHGNNYSGRIWNDTNTLATRLQELFTVKEMTGMTEREMSAKISDEFGVAINVAKRLVRTEANYMMHQAKIQGWKEQGIERYMLVAVLDLKTSKFCQSMDGKDFPVADAVSKGKEGNLPPFHPWCRTIAIAYFGERTRRGTRVARDPFTGESFTIPRSKTYRDWEQMIMERHSADKVETARLKLERFGADENQWKRHRESLGDVIPDTFEKFQEIKYNNLEEYERFKNLYREVNWQRRAQENLVRGTDRKVPIEAEPNSVHDKYQNGVLEQRRYFGRTGRPRLDIDFSNHGNSKQHPIVPHAHNWDSFTKPNGDMGRRREIRGRELTEAEKMANIDVLERSPDDE